MTWPRLEMIEEAQGIFSNSIFEFITRIWNLQSAMHWLHFMVSCALHSKAPFTRYRFHLITDSVAQSDMQFLPVYTTPFSYHIGLGLCLHEYVLGGRCGNFAFVLDSLRSSILVFCQGSHLGAKSKALREQELCKIKTN